jgi:hypothetical protein
VESLQLQDRAFVLSCRTGRRHIAFDCAVSGSPLHLLSIVNISTWIEPLSIYQSKNRSPIRLFSTSVSTKCVTPSLFDQPLLDKFLRVLSHTWIGTVLHHSPEEISQDLRVKVEHSSKEQHRSTHVPSASVRGRSA